MSTLTRHLPALVDVVVGGASNNEVTGPSRDADADIITAGREPRLHRAPPGRLVRLPAGPPLAGTVVITAAAQPGGDRAQFTVSALITGGQPDTVYDLVGNDCSALAPLPDHVWATGLTNGVGAAQLSGYAWSGAVADQYWLALSPSPVYASPGLRGRFAQGSAVPFPAGQAPCAPSP
jgi:hypothetical protein